MDSKGAFITIKPKDALVARHIAYYYFHISEDPSFSKKFFFYPNYKHALTIYKGSDARLTEEGSIIGQTKGDKISCFYTINIDKSFKVELHGCFNKIGVVFNPLGLNHFISRPLCDVFKSSIAVFDYFGETFIDVVEAVYDEPGGDAKAVLLDIFFAKQYVGFNEPIVKTAVAAILNSNSSLKVEELSNMLNVNRKTLLRLFNKHLGCSVEEYKKLVMFRNALDYSQQKSEDASLTDVALYNLYYDQAHFIKHFKAVTKLQPKVLLSNLTKLGSNEVVYWHFED